MSVFDQPTNRIGSHSVKWELHKDAIPLWVADMDFEVANEIKEALSSTVDHGIFGYSMIPKAYYQAEILWWKKRHNLDIKRSWILPTTGVIPALSSSVDAITKPGDKVVVQSPVYQYFYSSVTNNGAELLYNDLIYQDGAYSIDFSLLEKQLHDKDTKAMILCNPHNPVGRVWTESELTKLLYLCKVNNVVLISDEIHRDLTFNNYTSVLGLSKEFNENIIVCTAPSKTFNLAGLKVANVVIPDKKLRELVNKSLNNKEVIEPGVFGINGLIAAYNYGDKWLDELLIYLKNNHVFAKELLLNELPKLHIIDLQGTYLLWIDISAYTTDSKTVEKSLLKEYGVFVNGGYKYGYNSSQFIRINLATQKAVLEEGLKRVIKYFKK